MVEVVWRGFLSDSRIYRSYLNIIDNKKTNPAIIYGDNNSTYVKIRSWSKLQENKYLVRFSINEISGKKQVFNKIAVVEFKYINTKLSEDQENVNPIGFNVIGYRVDDDGS
ncbi:MAG TPA: type IV secretion system protein [Candidatus Megaira endosymbiont of Hartmannula sinica]|nr:type IV secretion system protein [Candidatus Megaera endosymbiont of Hartmannula sinica]